MPKLIDFPIKQETGLRITNKTEDKAELVLYGAIGDYYDGIKAKDVSNALKGLDPKIKNLDIRLNSPGGDVFEGIAIYNRLKQHKAKITMYVDGLAASIASIIMLAGDEIILGEGTQVMIHKPWTFAFGNATDLEEMIQRLDDVENQLVSIYAKRTGLDRIEIKNMLAAETWMDDEEAIEYGFATGKIENKYQIAASVDVPWIGKKPTLNKADRLVKDKIVELKKSIEGYLAR